MHLRPLRRLALLTTCGALAAACGPAVDTTRSLAALIAPPQGLARPGQLTVAVPTDLPPYGLRGAAGSTGFAVDLGRVMAQRMGVRLTVVALDPGDLPTAARGGGVDVVLGTIPVSRTVPAPPDLTLLPYLRGSSTLMVKQDSAYQPHQLDELCGHSVTVVDGTPQQAQLAETAGICGSAAPVAVNARTDGEALGSVRSARADVYLADVATAAYDTARAADLMSTGDRIGDVRLAMGVRTGSAPLTEAITRDFYMVQSDGTYELLLQKWSLAGENL
jgi:ABC-type amino acid transport substrate-binding protein